jgi:hypothetical protein
VLGGQKIDIASFNITYALDAIPQATITPTVGREPRSGSEANAVEALLDAAPFTPIQIFIKGETTEDSPRGQEFPGFVYDEEMKVFDGYYQGVSYRSQRNPAGGSVQVQGSAAGWLVGLTGTSSKNKVNAVKGPGGFAEITNLKGEGVGLFDLSSAVISTPGSAGVDLWKEYIKELYYQITEEPNVWGESDNTSATEALDKMDDEATFDGAADNTLVLALQAAGVDVPDYILAKWFAVEVAHKVFKGWRMSNLWDSLRAVAHAFKFRIVPLIDTATCAPVFGALAGEPYVFIETDEYDDVYLDAQTPALISKVVLTGSVGMSSSPWATESRKSAVIGIATAEDAWFGPVAPVTGITVVRNAPSWLEAEASIGKLSRQSLGGDKNVVPDAVNPTANAKAPDDDYQEKFNNYITSELGDRLARAILLDEIFSIRQGQLSGRFRLDVCPGSTVAVTVIDDRFSSFNDDPKYVYGLVHVVQIGMDSGGAGGTGKAFTRFGLQNVRTGQEQTGFGGYLVAESHPLYETAFRGARLWTES